jgi:hypothetical protein
MRYNDGVSGTLAAHYAGTFKDPTIAAERYMKVVVSENIIDRLDTIFDEVTKTAPSKPSKTAKRPKTIKKYETYLNDIADIDTLAAELQQQISGSAEPDKLPIQDLIKRYQAQLITIEPKRMKINICSLCGSNMTMHSDTSELICDASDCGQIVAVQGIVFEDSQIYTQPQQQLSSGKVKKHDPNGHLAKWIEKILAKEDYTFPDDVVKTIDAMVVSEYTRGGRLRPMHNIRCEKFRNWMQAKNFTTCYDHAPLLRKIITGLHGPPVCPPELEPEEQQEILIEASIAMREYEDVIKDPVVLQRLGKDRVRNKFYYPYIFWQVIYLKITDERKFKLLECIHLQSDDTLHRNDIVWREICNRRGYQYRSANNNL